MFKEFTITSKDEQVLKGNSWIIENPIGMVVIAHGMAEHSLRYEPFALFLNSNGYNVYMVDHIGHGKNQYLGQGVWPRHGFDDCVDNLNVLIDSLKEYCLPTYLMGHSMGSFISQAYMERYNPTHLKKVVLIGSSGPQAIYKLGSIVTKLHAIGKDGTKRSPFLNRITFSSYNKKIDNPKTEFDWVCANEKELEKYIKDDDCGFVPTINFFVSFTENLAKLHKKKNLLKINKERPILLVAGKEDPVGQYAKGVEKLNKIYKKLGIDSDMIIYPNMRHEILNEVNNKDVYMDILNFIKK